MGSGFSERNSEDGLYYIPVLLFPPVCLTPQVLLIRDVSIIIDATAVVALENVLRIVVELWHPCSTFIVLAQLQA